MEPARVHDLLGRGVSLRRINTGLHVPFWGIRAEEQTFDLIERCHQFRPRLGPGAFYSHVTAARIRGVPLPPWFERDLRLHVSFPAGHRAPAANQIVGHEIQVRIDDVEFLDGLPVALPARIVRDLAPMLSVPDLVAVVDAMLHDGIVTDEQLARMASVKGFRGRRRILAALAWADPGAETRPESLLRIAALTAGLPPLFVNCEIRDPRGRFVARSDLRFRDYPVILEYDGDGHRTDPAQWRHDVARYSALEDLGFDVIRALADDLPRFEAAIARARARLMRRGWRP